MGATMPEKKKGGGQGTGSVEFVYSLLSFPMEPKFQGVEFWVHSRGWYGGIWGDGTKFWWD